MKRKATLLWGLQLICATAMGSNVVTYLEDASNKAAGKGYLKNWSTDNAYVYVTAEFNNPGDSQCVSPVSSDSLQALFVQNNLDLGIAVQPFGFYGVDSKKEVPLATYTFTSEKQFCKSSWREPIVIVPPTPFAVSPADYSEDPSLVIQFRSSAIPSLSVVEPMQALIGVAGSMATGGAATTVVGITKIANGPAVDFLTKEFEKRRKTQAEGTLILKLTWNEIAEGLKEKSFSLINGERKWLEGSDVAIARVKSNPAAAGNKTILQTTFKFGVRRSIFVKDSELSAKFLPPAALVAAPYAILNHPHLAGVPSIYQRINSEAPSMLQGLSSGQVASCDSLLVTIKELGFNKLDRALIAGAVLDEANKRWRSDTAFYTACFRSEPSIPTTLADIDAAYFPVAPPPPPVLPELELFTNLPANWPSELTKYLTTARMGLFSKGEARLSGLALSDSIKTQKISTIAGVDQLLSEEQAANADVTLGDLIRNIQITQAGCLFGFPSQDRQTWFVALIIAAKERGGNIEPYIVEAQFDANNVNISQPKSVRLMPVLSPIAVNYAAWFDNANFSSRSLCARPSGKDGYAVLQSLRGGKL